MSEVEVQQEQPQELSEIQQLAREGKYKTVDGSAVICVLCEKKSYTAETVFFEKLPYHKDCFKCTRCNKKIEGGFNATQFDYKLYCRTCFQQSGFNRQQAQVKWTPKASGSSTPVNSQFANLGGGGMSCTACEKTVYPAEALQFEKCNYHPACFACSECSLKMTLNQANKFEDRIFCTSCWNQGGYVAKQRDAAKTWTPKDSGAQATYNPIAAKLGGGGMSCNACEKTVYPAEALTFEKKQYHPACFSCSECSLKMTLNQANQFEDRIFCTSCWNQGGYVAKQRDAAKTWTPKDSGAQATYNPIAAKLGGGGSKCTTCDKTVYSAETLMFEKKPYHPACFACSECSLKMTLAQANQFEDRIFCTSCWNQGGYVKKQRDAAQAWTPKESSATYNPIAAKLGGGGLKCRCCEKTVYPAEALLYEGFHYHPLCFKCTHCNARIENINQAQHNRKNPYHTRCFQELNLHRPENA